MNLQGKRKRHSSDDFIVGGGVGAKVILWSLSKEEETVLVSDCVSCRAAPCTCGPQDMSACWYFCSHRSMVKM